MDYRFCPHCGKELIEQSSFCPYCGGSLQDSSKQMEEDGGLGQLQEGTSSPKKSPDGRYKWLIVGVVLAAIVIFAVIQFQSNSPEEVSADFVEYVSDVDVEAAYDLLASSADENLKEEFRDMAEELKESGSEIRQEYQMDVESFHIDDKEKTSEDRVTVYGTITYEDGEEVSAGIELVKEGRKWRVIDSY